MSSKKISTLADKVTIIGTELIPIAYNGLNYSITPNELNTYIGNNLNLGYKVYTALLTQVGTSAPTAIILKNTLGTIVWTRSSTGVYLGTLSNAFTSNKTWLSLVDDIVDGASGTFPSITRTSSSIITISINSPTDDELLNTSIEIRVYS